jgi:hypothetical protein
MLTAKQKVFNDVVRAFQRFDEAKLDLQTSVERAARIFPDDKMLTDFADMVQRVDSGIAKEVVAHLLARKVA